MKSGDVPKESRDHEDLELLEATSKKRQDNSTTAFRESRVFGGYSWLTQFGKCISTTCWNQDNFVSVGHLEFKTHYDMATLKTCSIKTLTDPG